MSPEQTPSLFDQPVEPRETDEQFASKLIGRRVTRSYPETKLWTVGELVQKVRSLVEKTYGEVWVEGEISNWRPAASGHIYFTLKDSVSQISVVIFRRHAALLQFAPNDGDAVRLRGQMSVYESRGHMQIVAERMEPVGLGAVLADLRDLKERLRREGLFDRKRELPPYPVCIGVVTSAEAAALRDVIKVCRRRHAAVRLLIYPASVQGPRCAEEIAAGVEWFSQRPGLVDLVMVIRGGGSWEDLHGFDAEMVARAIGTCAVPVVTGIGHATDSTLADAAADLAAPTPSAAAELVTAAQHRVQEQIDRFNQRLFRAASFEILNARQRFAQINAEMVMQRTADALSRRAQYIDEMIFRSESALQRKVKALHQRCEGLFSKILANNPRQQINSATLRVATAQGRLFSARRTAFAATLQRVLAADISLHALNPTRVLARGYSLACNVEGELIRSVDAIAVGGTLITHFVDGQLRSTVFEREPKRSTPLQPQKG